MSRKARYFVIVSHCLLNPAARVHMLGRRFMLAKIVCDFMLSKHICVIQLPCPEFTAMGYWRNPQGRQQYDNVFFRKHCRTELERYVDMVEELIENDNTLLCFIGIQGSPTCSICWGKHKQNKYKTESMMPADPDPGCDFASESDCCENTVQECHKDSLKSTQEKESGYGVMTAVLDEMLKERGIEVPYLEAPVKESLQSERAHRFFQDLNALLRPAHPRHSCDCACSDHLDSSHSEPESGLTSSPDTKSSAICNCKPHYESSSCDCNSSHNPAPDCGCNNADTDNHD